MIEQSKQLFEYILGVRRAIHMHPELSFCEQATSRLIAGELDKEGIPYEIVSNTGILARIDSGAPTDEVVVLRADMDALPICETTPVAFASTNGAMHACGHDIHSASLLGALILLHRNKHLFQGTILGLFQPGEECDPGGASLVLAEGVFDRFNPKAFIALHVAPEIPVGSFGFRAGQYMASADELHLTIRGTGGHAALPHTLTDPVLATAHLITELQQIVSRNCSPLVPSVLSVGKVIADGATNIIPREVFVEGTFRTMDEEWRKEAKERIRAIVTGVCAAHNVTAEIDLKSGYPCVVNHAGITALCRASLSEWVGEEHITALDLRMTSEDFGFFTARYPAMLYRLGVGRSDDQPTGNLHSASFFPDEESLVYGTASLAKLALRLTEI